MKEPAGGPDEGDLASPNRQARDSQPPRAAASPLIPLLARVMRNWTDDLVQDTKLILNTFDGGVEKNTAYQSLGDTCLHVAQWADTAKTDAPPSQHVLLDALASMHTAGRDCASGAASQNATLLNEATTEMNLATDGVCALPGAVQSTSSG